MSIYDSLTGKQELVADDLSMIKRGMTAKELFNSESSFTPTEAQLDAMNSGITSEKVAQININKNNILSIHDDIYGTHTETVDQITAVSTAIAPKTYKWIATILPENVTVNYVKQIVTGNSTDYVKLELWEKNDNAYTLSRTITASSVTEKGALYELTFGGFKTTKETILTFADSSSGWLRYDNASGYSCKKFSASLTTVTNADISDTASVRLQYAISYTTEFPKIAIVDSTGNGDYTSLVQAVAELPDNATIILKQGIYDGTVRAFSKRINIIGTDRKQCIIRSTDGRYAYPALECSCGYISNVTIKSEYINGVSQEIPTTDSGAYAVHCEKNATNESIAIGNSLTLENCDLISDFFPAIGIGAFKNWSVNLINCNIISNQPVGRATYTDTGGLGALYFHDMNGEKGTAVLNVKDTVIQSTILANTMTLYDLNQANVDIQCRFINNTIYSAVNGFTDSVYFRGITTAFGNNFHLQPISHGNTGSVLNS